MTIEKDMLNKFLREVYNNLIERQELSPTTAKAYVRRIERAILEKRKEYYTISIKLAVKEVLYSAKLPEKVWFTILAYKARIF